MHKEFSPHTPRWAGTRRNITCSHPWGRRRIHTDNKVHCMGADPLYGALSQRGLLNPIKPPYNQSRPDSQCKLTTSAFNWLLISMPAVLVTVPTKLAASFINFFHYCSPSSRFYSAGNDNRSRHTDSPSGRHPIWTISAPTSIISPFLHQMLFLLQPSQFILAWDRHGIMLACIPSGLVKTKGKGKWFHTPTESYSTQNR